MPTFGRPARIEGARTAGIGVSYHPFLHEALIAQADAIDFAEVPTELYADPARRSLIDGAGSALAAVQAAMPCLWRGSMLSLGSVDAETLAPTFGRVRDTVAMTPGASLVETIGFRRVAGRDLGVSFELPRTEAAAAWIAARHRATAEALGTELLLELAPQGIVAPSHAMDRANFLARVAALSGCGLVIDAADLASLAGGDGTEAAATRLRGNVAMAALSGGSEAEWANLATLVAHAGVRSIVLRRERRLFGIDTLRADAARARALLDTVGDAVRGRAATHPRPLPGREGGRDADVAALGAEQVAFAAFCLDGGPAPATLAAATDAQRTVLSNSVQAYQTWRAEVDDMHKAQQLAMFMGMDNSGAAPGRRP